MAVSLSIWAMERARPKSASLTWHSELRSRLLGLMSLRGRRGDQGVFGRAEGRDGRKDARGWGNGAQGAGKAGALRERKGESSADRRGRRSRTRIVTGAEAPRSACT